MAKKIDTVTVEVVRNLLMSIAEETYGMATEDEGLSIE